MSERRPSIKKKLPAMSTARPPAIAVVRGSMSRVSMSRVPLATGQHVPLVRAPLPVQARTNELLVRVRSYPAHEPRSIARPKRSTRRDA